VHSAGPPALVGNTSYSVALERKIADFLKMEEAVLYPTGWATGFGVIKGLVRSADHVVMDIPSNINTAATSPIRADARPRLERLRPKRSMVSPRFDHLVV